MKKILTILFIIFPLLSFSINYTSNNNYTGYWNNINSWSINIPTNDDINLGNGTLTINGFIKWETENPLDSTLSFSGGGGGNIIVNDTLIIYGDLYLGNKYNLTVNGILIIYGNLITTNQIEISSSGYLIVQGDVDFGGSQGGFEPGTESNVYIGGTCSNGDGCGSTSNDSTDLDNSDIDVSDFYNNNDPTICNPPETGNLYYIPNIFG